MSLDPAWSGVIGAFVGGAATFVGTVYSQREARKERSKDRASENERAEAQRRADDERLRAERAAEAERWERDRRHEREEARRAEWAPDRKSRYLTAIAVAARLKGMLTIETARRISADATSQAYILDDQARMHLEEQMRSLREAVAEASVFTKPETSHAADEMIGKFGAWILNFQWPQLFDNEDHMADLREALIWHGTFVVRVQTELGIHRADELGEADYMDPTPASRETAPEPD